MSPPTFSLAWSEYPSWSAFGVAADIGLIDGAAGGLGPIEQKWNVDIELKERAYDPCIQEYSAAAIDAVCITNMDVLAPSLTRDSVAILPTSTSVGADACIVVDVEVSDPKQGVAELRKHKVYGLAKSVSEYAFVRNLELLGEKESDHQFTDMPPDAAALALQTKRPGYNAIMVWNPFVLQTLKTNPEAKVLFSTAAIPEEVIDMVVVAKESLDKPGGKDFACAIIDTFYQFNQRLAEPAQRNELLVKLGEKFSDLSAEEMAQAVEQTRFYATPDDALQLFQGTKFPETMQKVVTFCVDHQIVESAPKYSFAGAEGGPHLRFDPSYIQLVKDKQE